MEQRIDNPYQAPAQSDVAALPLGKMLPVDSIYASRWSRLAAAVIDGLLGVGINLGFVLYVLGKEVFTQPSPDYTFADQAILFVFGLAVYLALHGVLLHRHGQTIGKLLHGIRIIDCDGAGRVPLKRILLLRVLPLSVIASVPIVGPWLALIDPVFIFFNKQRMCAHDLLARTMVVKVGRSSPRPGQPG
ncbi:MAG: RDD family protein [Planctomycetes bacterium]|nr:RDD family protein [Planctomycetota bacterium]